MPSRLQLHRYLKNDYLVPLFFFINVRELSFAVSLALCGVEIEHFGIKLSTEFSPCSTSLFISPSHSSHFHSTTTFTRPAMKQRFSSLDVRVSVQLSYSAIEKTNSPRL